MTLYWIDNIDKFIEHNASPAIQQRGKTLSNIGAIRSISYDTEKNEGVVEVSAGELFTVQIKNGVNQDFRNIEVNCNCDYKQGVCKHSVAALHALKKKFQYNSAAIINLINQTNATHNSSSEIDITPELIHKYQLEVSYPVHIRDKSDMVIKYKVLSDNHLSFDTGEKTVKWHGDGYNWETVDFFKTDQGVTSRCSCAKNVVELCPHQLKVFYHIIIELEQSSLLIDFPNIKELQKQAVEDYGLGSESEVDQFFSITLTEKGCDYIPKDKDMVSFSEHLYLKKKLEQIQKTDPYLAISSSESIENHLQGIAFYIDHQSDGLPLRMHIISGKTNKGNDKIVSNVQEVEDPTIIIPALRGFYLEFERIKSLYNSQFPDVVHPKLLMLMQKYASALEDTPLYQMKEKFSFRRADMRVLEWSGNPADVEISVRKNNAQKVIEGHLILGDEKVSISKNNFEYNPIALVHQSTLYFFKSIKMAQLFKLLLERPVMKYSAKANQSFNEQLAGLSQLVSIDSEAIAEDIKSIEIAPVSKHIQLSESGEHLIVQPKVKYTDQKYYMPNLDRVALISGDHLTRVDRDLDFESAFVEELKQLDNEWQKQNTSGYFYKHLDNVVNTAWIFDLYEYCRENDIEILGYEALERINYNPNKANININLSSGIDWFEGDVNVLFGDQSAELKSLRDAIIKGQNTVELKDGSRGLLPEEWIVKLSTIFRNSSIEGEKLLMSKMKFNLLDSLFDEINDEQLRLEIEYRKRLLLNFDQIEEVPIPDTVQATLRPYQKQGFYWLKFLDDFGFGGCLADDMGLGKTLQVLTFLAYKKEQSGGTNLVVVPKSLLFNWQDEINKFCPTLSYLVYHGNKRKLDLRKLDQYDVILSTYGTVTNDIEDLMGFHFSYAILDESQAIKNPTSKRYKAMRLITSENKIVMTGTPIENQTFDLYAQFNFINPGFFGSSNQFKVNYAEPIDMYGNETVSLELRKLVKPFLLRRKKEQVAKDLPPKTESIIYVEMGKKQRVIYDSFLQRYKDYVSQKISENGLQRSKMFVIEALLKLRQICNSPALLNEDQKYPNESVKIDVLMEDLAEIITHHKVLVISQFTSMLALIKERIEAAHIPYEYLDGSTRDRKKVVDNFNDNDEYRIFLLSLKAGGVGLNLASAEYVFLVDPWWNPAAESQAIDRAHRIGQENHVFAYRMICKDSIEEKIQQLQQRKRKMASDIIQVEDNFMKSLSQDDIMALFN